MQGQNTATLTKTGGAMNHPLTTSAHPLPHWGEGRGEGGKIHGSPDSPIAPWEHDPNRSGARPCPRNQEGESRTRMRTRRRTKGRFMQTPLANLVAGMKRFSGRDHPKARLWNRGFHESAP